MVNKHFTCAGVWYAHLVALMHLGLPGVRQRFCIRAFFSAIRRAFQTLATVIFCQTRCVSAPFPQKNVEAQHKAYV